MTKPHPLKTFVDSQPPDFLTGLRAADALTRFLCGDKQPVQLRAVGGMFMTHAAYVRTEGFLFGTDAARQMLNAAIAEDPTISGADLLLAYNKYVKHAETEIGDFYAETMGSYMRHTTVESPALRPLRKLFARAFAPLFQNSGVLPALLAVKERVRPSAPADVVEEVEEDIDDDDAATLTDETAETEA